jgi:DNA-binding response OmpR family regulator
MAVRGGAVAKTVLVVEDDEMVADVVRINLTAQGFEVLHAPNGAAALAAVAQERPALVLLDVMMPEMDGWTVLSRLRETTDTTSLPVIMLSAKAMPADQVRGYNLGANGYLPKPFSSAELIAKVEQVLQDANAAAG